MGLDEEDGVGDVTTTSALVPVVFSTEMILDVVKLAMLVLLDGEIELVAATFDELSVSEREALSEDELLELLLIVGLPVIDAMGVSVVLATLKVVGASVMLSALVKVVLSDDDNVEIDTMTELIVVDEAELILSLLMLDVTTSIIELSILVAVRISDVAVVGLSGLELIKLSVEDSILEAVVVTPRSLLIVEVVVKASVLESDELGSSLVEEVVSLDTARLELEVAASELTSELSPLEIEVVAALLMLISLGVVELESVKSWLESVLVRLEIEETAVIVSEGPASGDVILEAAMALKMLSVSLDRVSVELFIFEDAVMNTVGVASEDITSLAVLDISLEVDVKDKGATKLSGVGIAGAALLVLSVEDGREEVRVPRRLVSEATLALSRELLGAIEAEDDSVERDDVPSEEETVLSAEIEANTGLVATAVVAIEGKTELMSGDEADLTIEKRSELLRSLLVLIEVGNKPAAGRLLLVLNGAMTELSSVDVAVILLEEANVEVIRVMAVEVGSEAVAASLIVVLLNGVDETSLVDKVTNEEEIREEAVEMNETSEDAVEVGVAMSDDSVVVELELTTGVEVKDSVSLHEARFVELDKGVKDEDDVGDAARLEELRDETDSKYTTALSVPSRGTESPVFALESG